MNLWKVSTIVLAMMFTVSVGRDAVRSAGAEKQPHMRAALQALENAAAQLQKATPDKGGHRARAMQLTDQAIDAVKKGIAFDNAH
jgi:hypothetical protein